MSKVNICLAELGAQIIGFSSTSDEQLCQPSNVLVEQDDRIWNSAEGLPQFLTISLEAVVLKYSHIAAIGFYCWHDYSTNPKTVEIEVAQSPNDEFVLWAELQLVHQKGKQFFDLQPVPASYRIIRVKITETFEDYETYLNQIILLAQTGEPKTPQLTIQELDSHAKPTPTWNGPFSKTQKNFKAKDKKEVLRKIQTQQALRDSEEEYRENTFHHQQVYSISPSRKGGEVDREQSMDPGQEDKDQSFNNSVALLALSKKALEMEEDIEDVKRKLEVLDMKVTYSFENMQQHILESVDKIVESKLKKFKEEIKQEMKASSMKSDLREVKSQKDKRQFVSSREINDDNEYEIPRGKSSRDNMPPKSLHLNNLAQSTAQKGPSGKDNIGNLMAQLSNKLKERELKVRKMESRRDGEVRRQDEKSRKLRQQYHF